MGGILSKLQWELDIGASIIDRGVVRFRVWAPLVKNVSVRLTGMSGTQEIPLLKDEWGYFEGNGFDVFQSDRYEYVLESGATRPDPASRFQPGGVHGPSQIIDAKGFPWSDTAWKGVPLKDLIIYELHVGTFTREGTFESIIACLEHLCHLGVTAIELMPVCQFPGARNWGYDGVYPFAPQNSYGRPEGLKRLIDACHGKGLAVILDVVYNHLGPEGNYLASFAPYFTDRYKTPWGDAINFDGPYSDHVRHYFISNALYWIIEYHVDALRIDAIQGIFDFSAVHFLRELSDAVRSLRDSLERKIHVIVESDLNDVRVIDEPEIGGYGLDGQWNDDFHHALHALLTSETRAYYIDFGGLDLMAKALSEGFVYSGQYSQYRKRRHGSSSKKRPVNQFIVFSQNHDQIGNNITRPDYAKSLEQLKLGAGMVLLSPYIPLLFMGEEYGERAPFHYFVSHEDPALVDAVRKMRGKEFAILWQKVPADPEAQGTFLDSKIDIRGYRSAEQKQLYNLYQNLIRLRRENSVLANPIKGQMEVKEFESEKTIFVKRWYGGESIFCLYNFGGTAAHVNVKLPEGTWVRVIDSSSDEWGGKGQCAPEFIESNDSQVAIDLAPYSFALYNERKV
jgi:maltooligosyltrehalose trehalohydrolase